MKKTYTVEDVQKILVASIMFSNSNNNQGLSLVKGKNFGEKAQTIINAYDRVKDTDLSVLSVVQMISNKW